MGAREDPCEVGRARRPKGLPAGLTVDEASPVMSHQGRDKWRITILARCGGLRLFEAFRVRVKDLDFERGEITVREGKGDKDRITMLPQAVIRRLQARLRRVEAMHLQDSADGCGRVEPRHALAPQCPTANRKWRWQFVFPQERPWRNPQTTEQGRYYADESLLKGAVAAAVRWPEITKRVTSYTFRHSFDTRLLADGYDIRTVR